jgi:dTMP kinase
MNKGKFVMIDGLDGAGKGIAVNALKEYAEKQGKKVLDLREYWKEKSGFPDITEFDVIISAEPTFTNIGKKIRTELIKNGNNYSAIEIAQAYSDDRKELYEKIIVPAMNSGKWVFQERGIITSLVYQPVMENGLSVEEIKQLDGNNFCLEHAPDLLVIITVDSEVVMNRLNKRNKQDNAIFEKLEFQNKVKDIYTSKWLKELFESKGSKVCYLDTNPPKTIDDTKEKIVELFLSSIS